MNTTATPRTSTALLGLVTCLPAVSLVATLARMSDTFSRTAAPIATTSMSFEVAKDLWPAVIGLVLAAPLVAFYVWHATTRAKLQNVWWKLLWIGLLIFATPVSMPVYWYAHVWAPLPSAEPRHAR